jgi:hypothetical protein
MIAAARQPAGSRLGGIVKQASLLRFTGAVKAGRFALHS